MSLIPLLYSNWLESLGHPHTLMDQHFGHGVNPENLTVSAMGNRNRFTSSYSAPKDAITRCLTNNYVRPWALFFRQGQGGTSTVKVDKNQFQIIIEVQHFAPEEINVKVTDKTVIVEAKHEEKEDEHGFVSRQFTRRYIIPEQCDIDKIWSEISSDGILTIVVPRKEKPELNGGRTINIGFTGKPAMSGSSEAKPEQPKEAEKK